jgi:hypothetical protein
VSGRWFDSAAYTNTATVNTANYCISATGATSGAFKAAQVQGTNLITRSMDQNGTIYDAVSCGGTALN